MSIKATWFTLSAEQQRDLDERVKSPGWRLVSGRELPAVFPEALREKIDSAVMVATPTSTGGTYLVYSANRIDHKPQKIDIQPFGLIVHSTGPSSSGVFLDHGNWEGRTESPPSGFWDEAERSGIGDYFLANPPEGLREGTLDRLPTGHRGAFDAIVREIRTRTDGRKS